MTMMHLIKDLYKVKGMNGFFTEEAVKGLTKTTCNKAQKGDCYSALWRVYNNKPFRIYTTLDRKNYKLGYAIGEHRYYDSEAEREEVRRIENIKIRVDK